MEVEYNPDSDRWYVREENRPDRPELEFTTVEWDAFKKGVLAGQFDL